LSEATEYIYIRIFPCAVCRQSLMARRIINGWILMCGCGEKYARHFKTEDNKLWNRSVFPRSE